MEARNQMEELAESAKEFVRLQWEILRLQIVNVVSSQVAGLVSSLIFASLFLLIILLLDVGAGFYLGDFLDSTALGFICLAGIHVLFVLFLYLLREKLIKRPVRNRVISRFTKNIDAERS